MAPQMHPLTPLTIAETDAARDILCTAHPNAAIYFRIVTLLEPAKAELTRYLDAEHSGQLSSRTTRPARQAKIHYDAIEKGSKVPVYQEAVVCLDSKKRIRHEMISSEFHASLTV